MIESIHKLQSLLQSGSDFITNLTSSQLLEKAAPNKWSIQEILGHLIDSGINNLQRFAEIQYERKPFKIRQYKQNELVSANEYQAAEIKELLTLWLAINRRIVVVTALQTKNSLSYSIEIGEGEFSDLRYLMTDYVDHMEHHLQQMKRK